MSTNRALRYMPRTIRDDVDGAIELPRAARGEWFRMIRRAIRLAPQRHSRQLLRRLTDRGWPLRVVVAQVYGRAAEAALFA